MGIPANQTLEVSLRPRIEVLQTGTPLCAVSTLSVTGLSVESSYLSAAPQQEIAVPVTVTTLCKSWKVKVGSRYTLAGARNKRMVTPSGPSSAQNDGCVRWRNGNPITVDWTSGLAATHSAGAPERLDDKSCHFFVQATWQSSVDLVCLPQKRMAPGGKDRWA
jgi:heme/copper-type cytochrome/quinol oxidase subunit 2